MRSECEINYIYVFTRAQEKHKWLFHETIGLFYNVAALYLWLFIVAYIIGKIAGLSVITSDYFMPVLQMYLLNSITMFEFVFIQNILSMKHGGIQAFIITIFLYAIPVTIISLLYQDFKSKAILYFIIPANQMYLWHEDRISNGVVEAFFYQPIYGFLFFFSLLFLLASIVVTYQIYRAFFIKSDMIELIKE